MPFREHAFRMDITIHAIGSGDRLGDGTNIGGMEITRDISIISRPVKSSNGGWL